MSDDSKWKPLSDVPQNPRHLTFEELVARDQAMQTELKAAQEKQAAAQKWVESWRETAETLEAEVVRFKAALAKEEGDNLSLARYRDRQTLEAEKRADAAEQQVRGLKEVLKVASNDEQDLLKKLQSWKEAHAAAEKRADAAEKKLKVLEANESHYAADCDKAWKTIIPGLDRDIAALRANLKTADADIQALRRDVQHWKTEAERVRTQATEEWATQQNVKYWSRRARTAENLLEKEQKAVLEAEKALKDSEEQHNATVVCSNHNLSVAMQYEEDIRALQKALEAEKHAALVMSRMAGNHRRKLDEIEQILTREDASPLEPTDG